MALPPDRIAEPVLAAKRHADRGTNTIEQLILARLLESGELDRHIRRMRTRYRQRRETLLQTLNPATAISDITGAAAGLHLLAYLTGGAAMETEATASAAARSLALTPLRPFWHEHRTALPGGLVLGYATPPEHGFADAVKRLERVLDALT